MRTHHLANIDDHAAGDRVRVNPHALRLVLRRRCRVGRGTEEYLQCLGCVVGMQEAARAWGSDEPADYRLPEAV